MHTRTRLAGRLLLGLGIVVLSTCSTNRKCDPAPAYFDPADHVLGRCPGIMGEIYLPFYDPFRASPTAKKAYNWYMKAVLPRDQIVTLPVNLPNSEPLELFTFARAKESANELTEKDRIIVHKFLQEVENHNAEIESLVLPLDDDEINLAYGKGPRITFDNTNVSTDENIRILVKYLSTENRSKILNFLDLNSENLSTGYLIYAFTDQLHIKTAWPVSLVQNQDTFEHGPLLVQRQIATDNSMNSISSSVQSLLNSSLLNKAALHTKIGDIDLELLKLITDEYHYLKSFLTDEFEKALSGFRITAIPDGKSEIWAEVREKNKEINIYPALIRAAYILSLTNNSSYLLRIARNSPIKLFREDSSLAHAEVVEEEAIRVIQCFKEMFSFTIAHEMAHVYLVNESETDADKAAVIHLSDVYGSAWLGAFDSLFYRSLQENVENVLGPISESQEQIFERRLKILKENLDFGATHRCSVDINADRSRSVSEYYPNDHDLLEPWIIKEIFSRRFTSKGRYVKHGQSCLWHPNGNISSIGNYFDGTKIGEWKYWDKVGNPLTTKIYETNVDVSEIDRINSEIDCIQMYGSPQHHL